MSLAHFSPGSTDVPARIPGSPPWVPASSPVGVVFSSLHVSSLVTELVTSHGTAAFISSVCLFLLVLVGPWGRRGAATFLTYRFVDVSVTLAERGV